MSFAGVPDQARLESVTNTVVDIWATVLEVDRTTIDARESDFFELGGYSLLVLQSISLLLAAHGVDEEEGQELEGILLNRFFETPTAVAQAECLLENLPVQV